jgi:hypothetical protein
MRQMQSHREVCCRNEREETTFRRIASFELRLALAAILRSDERIVEVRVWQVSDVADLTDDVCSWGQAVLQAPVTETVNSQS